MEPDALVDALASAGRRKRSSGFYFQVKLGGYNQIAGRRQDTAATDRCISCPVGGGHQTHHKKRGLRSQHAFLGTHLTSRTLEPGQDQP